MTDLNSQIREDIIAAGLKSEAAINAHLLARASAAQAAGDTEEVAAVLGFNAAALVKSLNPPKPSTPLPEPTAAAVAAHIAKSLPASTQYRRMRRGAEPAGWSGLTAEAEAGMIRAARERLAKSALERGDALLSKQFAALSDASLKIALRVAREVK
ncbi:MAG: hypothetical protein ACU0DW_13705 [Shimia sp.]